MHRPSIVLLPGAARRAMPMLALVTLLPACATTDTSAPYEPTTPTTYAVRGGLLVIPIELNEPLRRSHRIDARLDDGRDLDTTLYWIGARQTVDPSGYRWLPDPFGWDVWPAGEDLPPAAAGFWALAINVPDDAVGQGVWIEHHRVDVRWLSDPALARLGGRPMPWPAPVPAGATDSPYFGRLVDPVRRNPLTRWRYKLIVEGLRPAPIGEPDRHPGPARFDSHVLEALARRTEDLWRVAIARIRQDDPDLARRFVRRLVDVVDFGDGVVAPAWPTNQLVLETVRNALLAPRGTPDSRVQAVRQWLDEQPTAVAWVIDHAGRTDALSGDTLATLGVANLGRATVLAGASDPRRPSRRDVVPVAAGHAATLSIPVAAPEGSEATARVEVDAGRWHAARAIVSGPVEATPPGRRMGPQLGDWTMTSWFTGVPVRAVRADGRLGVAAQLFRRTGTGSDASWAVFIECPRPLDERYATPKAGTDWVRLWIGPTGDPKAVIRVWRHGRVRDEAADDREAGEVPGARVVDEGDRWTAMVPIDPALIDADGTIRLGLERVDGRARRWAWPEPMLPWQIEPARVRVDTTAWDRHAAR